ncbi:MAG: hypothetical protein IMY79_02935 [Chloroflexi bacterium]|nr:hypothetical protein [Chloroflexota bacterium]
MWTYKKPKLVKCIDCGFIGVILGETFLLGTGHSFLQGVTAELPPVGRSNLADFAMEEPFSVRCFRGQVSWVVNSSGAVEPGLGDRNAIFNSLQQARKCPYFYGYRPGYTPQEHRDLQMESEGRKFMLKIAILSAVIGAAVGGLVAAIVSLAA